MNKTTDVPEHNATNVVSFFRSRHILPCSEVNHVFWRMTNRRIELDFIVSDEKVPASQGVLMTFISRAARYVLRKRVRTAVLFIVLTIITASMLSATAVSRAAQHEAGQIEKQAVGGFVLASNLQGSMLTPRGGGMVRPADVQRISKLSGVDSYMVRQNATADLVGASVVKVPGGDDYDAEKEQQFGNTANVIGTNDSSKLNVFTSHTLGMVDGRHLKASDKHMSMVHEDLAKTNGLKVGDTLTLKANPYDADNESHSTATVKTTIVGIFKGDSDRKVSSRAELTSNTVYTDLDTTSTLYQYKAGKEIYQDATFVLDKGVDVEKTMEAAKKLPVDWNNYQITRNDQYTSSMLNAARGVRSMMLGALIGVTISAVIVLSLMLLLWMNDRRQEMGVLVSLGIGKPSLIAQYLTEMILIGLPSLALGWLCARGVAQWLGASALRSVNASAAKELSSMGQVGGDLESNMSVRTLDSLTVSIDTTAVLYVSLGLLAVMLVCVAISCIPMLRKSPRSLSELR
jgi:putative ABC transport system permease protein